MCNSLPLLRLQFNNCRYLPGDAMPSASPKASPISLLLSTSRTPPSPPLFPTSINTGFFGYSRHVQGICDHVAKIMKHMHGLDFNPLTDIAICCGQSEAFAATMFATLIIQLEKYSARMSLRQFFGACHTRDCLAITNEVYEHITYDNMTHISLASLPGMQSRTIITSSLSKTYSVTGWRIGWAVASACIASAIRNIHTKLTDSTPPPFQEAAF
ncbi:Kynurenine--oxoglutarate transaminase [Camellia lanceoleosa]|uniref:Kynurenine--oxoglutarate transaminase n=1 Tax=Camellia lanceoleosa TaxID=1840588 RepID=A0ACC0FXA8_9ERIC|nr:Kynurenine--oxoglutarate transaminase [Camellia lanceoleosa]